MLYERQVLDRAAILRPEHVSQPGAPLLLLFWNFRHLYVVFETDSILLSLSVNSTFLLAFLLLGVSFHEGHLNFFIIIYQVQVFPDVLISTF